MTELDKQHKDSTHSLTDSSSEVPASSHRNSAVFLIVTNGEIISSFLSAKTLYTRYEFQNRELAGRRRVSRIRVVKMACSTSMAKRSNSNMSFTILGKNFKAEYTANEGQPHCKLDSADQDCVDQNGLKEL